MGLGEDQQRMMAQMRTQAGAISQREKDKERARNTLRQSQTDVKNTVMQGQGYVGQGTAEAAGALGDYYNQAGNYMQQGYGQAGQQLASGYNQADDRLGYGYQTARDDLGAMAGRGPKAYDALSRQPNRLGDLYGGGLGAGFEGDPGYQFRLKQGQEAINNMASARGGRMGGDTLKALAEHNQNFASNEFNNYAQRQIGLAGAADQNQLSTLLNQAGRSDQAALARYQGDLGIAQGQAGLSQNYGQQASGLAQGYGQQAAGMSQAYGQNMGNMAMGVGQNLGTLYSGQGSQLASLGMQGAGLNAGTASQIANTYMPAPAQPQGPGMASQLLGIGGMALGAYLGGPGGAMAGKQIGTDIGNAYSVQNANYVQA